MAVTSYIITIRGLVQGVGFRPAVYRIASELGIKGWVKNTNENVLIGVTGDHSRIKKLIGRISTEHPPAAIIESVMEEPAELPEVMGFSIIESSSISSAITRVSPDISVCPDCLTDQKKQKHRLDYPLINCTNCGPRFSIIMSLPYDRPHTTMAEFDMCHVCRQEYENPPDRRFHAQPVACNSCGPAYMMHYGSEKYTNILEIIPKTAGLTDSGGIVAIKGTGGYNLICNAFHQEAVQRLRSLKKRDHKPFALMGRSLADIENFVFLNAEEKQLLDSWQRPIVLLKEKKKIGEAINRGLNRVGILLPYMPFHYQLFERLETDLIVFTSGNLSDEPVVISDRQALELFMPVADAVIGYNREIHNRVDDSVAFVSNRKPRLIRRSRGYAPSPVKVDFTCEGVMGAGAELNGTFAIGKGKEAILSQHTGDLKNPATLDFYEEGLKRFGELFKFSPRLIACDLHPGYLSTRFAESTGLPLIKVQHHHAHIASVMAEHRLDEKVTGISLDGTGLGDDGHLWGGEFLVCDLNDYERIGHYEYRPLPGGDKAIKEPWRNAFGLLHHYFGDGWDAVNIPFIDFIKRQPNYELLLQAIGKKINCPLTSSAGRLFDAVAALLMICPVAGHHAQAPMLLEAKINHEVKERYSFSLQSPIDLKPMITELIGDLEKKRDMAFIAARFHNTIVSINFTIACRIRKERGINRIVLGGGVFQNSYILEKTENMLNENGFETYSSQQVPSNDAGISLGQLAVAVCRNKK